MFPWLFRVTFFYFFKRDYWWFLIRLKHVAVSKVLRRKGASLQTSSYFNFLMPQPPLGPFFNLWPLNSEFFWSSTLWTISNYSPLLECLWWRFPPLCLSASTHPFAFCLLYLCWRNSFDEAPFPVVCIAMNVYHFYFFDIIFSVIWKFWN